MKGDPINDAMHVDVERGNAYITGDSPGVSIVDISDPENLTLFGEVDTFDDAGDVDVMGIFAYVGSGENLKLVDIRVMGLRIFFGCKL